MADRANRVTSQAGGLSVSRVRPAYQQVADQLRELVMGGTLAPGDRLPAESELSAMFGVSRTTVREALRMLTSQDLLTTTRGATGGTFVSRVHGDQITEYLETSLGLMTVAEDVKAEELLEARDLLEVPAARLAAGRRTEEHLQALRGAIKREMGTKVRSSKFTEHRTFHSILLDAAGNGLLNVMTEPVFRVLQARFLKPVVPDEFWTEVDTDHQKILDMIEASDAEGAAAAMRAHLGHLRAGYR